MISEVVLTREQILDQLVKTIEVHENISSFVGTRLCDHCESAEDEWAVKREKIAQQLQGLVKKYEFAKTLPRNELGIAVLAILGYIVKIQHTFASLIIMIDMIRGESFGDVYMDSMNSISTKTHDQLKALRELAEKQKNDTEGALECLDRLMKTTSSFVVKFQ
jgi:preprotein translocase subunit Sss1